MQITKKLNKKSGDRVMQITKTLYKISGDRVSIKHE